MIIPNTKAGNSFSEDRLVRVAVLGGLDVALNSFGLDSDNELANLGYKPKFFDEEDARLPLRQIAEILEHCSKITACDDFSLVLSKHQNIDVMGSVGLLMLTASSILDALHKLIEVLHVHASPISWIITNEGRYTSLQFSMEGQDLDPVQNRLVSQLSLAQCWQVLKIVSNGQMHIDRVLLHQPEPNDPNVFSAFFKAPIFFAAENDSIFFETRFMQMKTPYGNASIHEIIREKINQLPAYHTDHNLAQKVKINIRNRLGKHPSDLASIAALFGCDKRTLQRHLKSENNTSFRALLDETRFDLAKFYLLETNKPVIQIAYALGYSDVSNFTRAFQKVFCSTPSQWRKQVRLGAGK